MEVVKEKKCKVCGCTEHNSCVDKDGKPCYWAEPDLCSHCRKFRFVKYRNGFRKPEEYFKTEPELTKSEQDLLFHDLLKAWDGNTKLNRERLMAELIQRTAK